MLVQLLDRCSSVGGSLGVEVTGQIVHASHATILAGLAQVCVRVLWCIFVYGLFVCDYEWCVCIMCVCMCVSVSELKIKSRMLKLRHARMQLKHASSLSDAPPGGDPANPTTATTNNNGNANNDNNDEGPSKGTKRPAPPSKGRKGGAKKAKGGKKGGEVAAEEEEEKDGEGEGQEAGQQGEGEGEGGSGSGGGMSVEQVSSLANTLAQKLVNLFNAAQVGVFGRVVFSFQHCVGRCWDSFPVYAFVCAV